VQAHEGIKDQQPRLQSGNGLLQSDAIGGKIENRDHRSSWSWQQPAQCVRITLPLALSTAHNNMGVDLEN
jgi:hypothetical protein